MDSDGGGINAFAMNPAINTHVRAVVFLSEMTHCRFRYTCRLDTVLVTVTGPIYLLLLIIVTRNRSSKNERSSIEIKCFWDDATRVNTPGPSI